MTKANSLFVQIDSFSYEKEPILQDLKFCLSRGEHLAILGESGGGKTTLIHLIYGLLELKLGKITWKDQAVLGPESRLIPGAPYMKLVDQEFALMPMTTVGENIATDLPRFDLAKSERRVYELLNVVGLKNYKNTRASLLSGGQNSGLHWLRPWPAIQKFSYLTNPSVISIHTGALFYANSCLATPKPMKSLVLSRHMTPTRHWDMPIKLLF